MKNNNEQFENFIRDFEAIRMTNEEKNEIHENLDLFTRSYIPTPSPYMKHMLFFKKAMAVSLALLIAISISKPVSAKSLPGELLYNVKIIHEEIESSTIKEPEKKINFEIKRTETRIREAVVLAEEDKLDIKKQEKLAEDIKKHVRSISEKIDIIKEENPEKALTLNSNLKTTLKVNSKALEKVTEKPEIEKEKTDDKKPEEEINELAGETAEEEVEAEDTKEDEIEIIETEEINKVTEDNSLEELATKEIEKDIDIKTKSNNSFADIILNSIEKDIEKTEIVNTDIENEIIAEENTNKDDVFPNIDDSASEKSMQIDIIQTEEIVVEDIEIENIEQIDSTELIEEVIVETEGSIILDINLLNGIPNIDNTKIKILDSSIEISEDLRLEITSLENVLEAEERLKILLIELSQERNTEKIDIVVNLVEEKKLGQAYIEIQKEIEFLEEMKLSIELDIEEWSQEEVMLEEKTQI